MTNYPNIEKSGFRAHEYVGYAGGRVFRITRVEEGKRTIGWRARAQIGSHRDGAVNLIIAPTLNSLSRQLSDA
jgi:hypothetical protein